MLDAKKLMTQLIQNIMKTKSSAGNQQYTDSNFLLQLKQAESQGGMAEIQRKRVNWSSTMAKHGGGTPSTMKEKVSIFATELKTTTNGSNAKQVDPHLASKNKS